LNNREPPIEVKEKKKKTGFQRAQKADGGKGLKPYIYVKKWGEDTKERIEGAGKIIFG